MWDNNISSIIISDFFLRKDNFEMDFFRESRDEGWMS